MYCIYVIVKHCIGKTLSSWTCVAGRVLTGLDGYRCNSFIVDLRHKFTVGNMNEIPVFVRSSELGDRTWPVTWVYDGGISPIFHSYF